MWTSIAATSPIATGAGANDPSQVNSPVSRRSVASTAPSAPRNRTSALTSATGNRVCARTPSANCTSACGSAARNPSSGETVCGGNTVALPPPSVRATAAPGPSTATFRIELPVSGSSDPWLRASTKLAAAARRRSAGSGAGGDGAGPSRAPTRAARRNSRNTLSSTADSLTSPACTAATNASPQGPDGPGIATSSAADPVATVLRAAPQSETTRPSQAHSSFRTSRSSGDSVISAPLTAL